MAGRVTPSLISIWTSRHEVPARLADGVGVGDDDGEGEPDGVGEGVGDGDGVEVHASSEAAIKPNTNASRRVIGNYLASG